MATKKYNLSVKVGEYTDKTGAKKGRWQNVGAVMEGPDGGQFLMLAKWFNPAGVPDFSGKNALSESVLISCFAPTDREPGAEPPTYAQAQGKREPVRAPGSDDDIPY